MIDDKQIAEIRGEALAARVLASCALRLLISNNANAEKLVEVLSRYVDNTLSIALPQGGDDELNEIVRETARLRAQEDLAMMKAVATHKG